MTGARPARDAILRTTTPPMSFRPHPTRTILDLMAASQPTPNQANTGGKLHNCTRTYIITHRESPILPDTRTLTPPSPDNPQQKKGQDPLQNKETPT